MSKIDLEQVEGIGDVNNLSTTSKEIVGAINEVKGIGDFRQFGLGITGNATVNITDLNLNYNNGFYQASGDVALNFGTGINSLYKYGPIISINRNSVNFKILLYNAKMAFQDGLNNVYEIYHSGNFTPSNYALLSQVYTQGQALGLFVGLNGVQTIAGTKTFSSSPIIPTATLNNHAVNLGQVYSIINMNNNSTNTITEFDLEITSSFENVLNALPQLELNYAKAYIRNRTLGVAISIKNNTNNDVQLFGSSTSISEIFRLPTDIIDRLNQGIVNLVPHFKLSNSDPVSSYSSYQTFVEFGGRIRHPFGLLLSRNFETILFGEFDCLDI